MKDNTAIANFNVTFGENQEPMLSHLDDIIIPAFNSTIKRTVGVGEKKDKYYFVNSRIEKVGEDEVFTGQLVKDTELEVKSKIIGDELVEADEHYPAAPYSVFYIFLKNHRMILIRNQKGSPDLRSFRVTADKIITTYIKRYNSNESNINCLPEANVNVIGIPTLETWNNIFSKVEKVRGLELKFFPLNGDKNYSNITSILNGVLLKDTGAKQGTVKMGACENINGVREIVSNLDGVMEAKVTVDFPWRKGAEIRNNTIKERCTINADEKGINNPKVVIPFARDISSISKVSDENQKIYDEYRKKHEFSN
jgi:hypothetical protein